MTTAILIPSLDRPQRLRATIANLRETTPDALRMFCVSDPESFAILDELDEWYMDDAAVQDRRYVTRMNRLVENLPEGITEVFFGSDDVIHHPNWLENALPGLADHACVVVNDLHNQNGTQALMRRDYLDRACFDDPGKAFHHGYQHNFADTEQFATAHANHEYARALDSIVEHLHPLFGSSNALPWDATYRNASFGWDQDSRLFNARMALLASR